MPKLSPKQIEQLAVLARLSLMPAEKERYASQMSAVLDYMEMLNTVDAAEVEETCQVTGLEDVMREDVSRACDKETRAKLLAQFPDKAGDLLKVKAVFDDQH